MKIVESVFKRHNPGEKAKVSGQYMVMNPDGTPTGREKNVTEGEPFPPTPRKGQWYLLVDVTKHKRK